MGHSAGRYRVPQGSLVDRIPVARPARIVTTSITCRVGGVASARALLASW
jgi:hypothetical protein